MIGMSATYILDRRMQGYWDQEYYFNNPVQFLANLGDSPQLEGLRHSRFILANGRGPCDSPEYSERIARVLRGKGIPHRLELWGPDADHNWTTWRTMLPVFLNRLA
jgi:esterase/lipase superfamily enzyme